MNFPQLHLVIGKNDFRPQFEVALVTKKYTYATDAYALVRHNTEVLFDEAFINSLPEKGIGLTAEMIKTLRKKTIVSVKLLGQRIALRSSDIKKYPDMIFELPDISEFVFPDYEKVIISDDQIKPLHRISFNPEFLSNVLKALATDTNIANVFFSEETKAILIRPNRSELYSKSLAILMPAIQ